MAINVSCFLIKNEFQVAFRYIEESGHVVQNERSIFDVDVTVSNPVIEAHIIRVHKVKPKILEAASTPYTLYFRNGIPREPDWVAFWNSTNEVKVRTADAIAILEVGTRTFAVCHGHSSHFLNPFSVDLQFGLKTALNLIDFDSIRSADLFTPSEVNLRTRKQSTADTRFHDYDVNVLNTILKNITGRVREEHKYLCESIHGAANVRFSHVGDPATLSSKLESFLSHYASDYYREHGFGWIDQFSPILDQQALATHNAKLVESLNLHNDAIRLYIPSSLNYPGIVNFRFRLLGERNRKLHHDTNIATSLYTAMRENDISFDSYESVKKVRLEVVDHSDSNHIIDNYPLSSCLYFENTDGNSLVFLEEGSWYVVDPRFRAEIDTTVENVILNPLKLPMEFDKTILRDRHWHGETRKTYENWYNSELVASMKENGLLAELLDLKLVPTFGQGSIELCDVLFRDEGGMQYLVHNKYKYGSSALSHLFSQGSVSATLLTDLAFRITVNERYLGESALRLPEDAVFDPEQYTVVYGIISPPETIGDLPFFSKINLKVFYDNLRRMHFPVRIAFISDNTGVRST